MNTLDYYENPIILERIHCQLQRISNDQDKEDCRQEVFSTLYDMMPLDESAALRLVESIGRKFRRCCQKIAEQEACEYEDNCEGDW